MNKNTQGFQGNLIMGSGVLPNNINNQGKNPGQNNENI